MIELIAHNLAPIMFLSLIGFLLLGYPVAFSLAANGLLFFVIAVELSPYSNEILLDWPPLQTLPGRILDVNRRGRRGSARRAGRSCPANPPPSRISPG